jgi:putative transposase
MDLTAQVRLKPSPEQAEALGSTLLAFNAACNEASQMAWQARCFRRFPLHFLAYHPLRESTGLASRCLYAVIAKVSQAYATDQRTQRQFQPHGAMPQNGNACTFKPSKSEVSIWTTTGRHHIPFIADERNMELLQGKRGESDLILRDGKWYLHVSCEVETPPVAEPQGYLGVDLGIVSIATDSDGTVHSGAQVNGLRRRNRRLRQRLQSIGTKSAKRVLKLRRRKEERFARNENHRISKQIVAVAEDTGRGVALEDLKGIRDRVTVRRPQRATLSSWSFAQLRSFIEYKAERLGVALVAVDPRNTSRTCPACGNIDKRNRKSQSKFTCVSCGFSGLADHIAAVNIGRRAAGYQPNAASQMA